MVVHSEELLKRIGGKLPEILTQHEKNVKRYKRALNKTRRYKLSAEQVREIRWAWDRHIRPKQKVLAKYYGVSQSYIAAIIHGTYNRKDVVGEPKRKYIEYPK